MKICSFSLSLFRGDRQTYKMYCEEALGLLCVISHIFLHKFVFCLSRLGLGMCYGCPLCSSSSPEVPAWEFCLPPVCRHSDWTRWRLRRRCVGELSDTSHIFSFDPIIDWLQEQRINRAHKSAFHSPLWSGLDKNVEAWAFRSPFPSSIRTYGHWRWHCVMVA